jgi:hypothetical protein
MDNMLNMAQDRRRALRVQLRSHSSLTTADGGQPAHLLNLSESGALIAVIDDHQLSAGEPIALDIELPGGEVARMEGHVAHVKEHLIGLDCTPATDKDMAAIATVIAQAGDNQASP